MKGHDRNRAGDAGQRDAHRGLPASRRWGEFAAQEFRKLGNPQTGSCQRRGHNGFAAGFGFGGGPVMVTTADAPTRKLSSGFST